MKFLVSLIFISTLYITAQAQYAPQAGIAGSTAISATDSRFVGWATHCSVQRGLMNIAQPTLGYASVGDTNNILGAADRNVVSLGDSGVAVVTFDMPLYNGAGADFAVFENGFTNAQNPEEAFLELAFVEVSSDGIRYVRFPAISNMQDTAQDVDPNDYMNAREINNLAGKYITNYGTPFDLQELVDSPGLDISNITHIRIVDVIGSIGEYASHDSRGHIINDPYSTPFPSSGFDLDAVGAIYQVGKTAVAAVQKDISVRVYPNPATDYVTVTINGNSTKDITATLTDIAGKVVCRQTLDQQNNTILLHGCNNGLYYLLLQDGNGNRWVEKISKL